MGLNDDQLFRYWEKNIENRKIYRTISCEYIKPSMSRLDPKKNPHRILKDKLLELFNIVLKQEKKGVVFRLGWINREPKLSEVMQVSLNDFYENTIDFTTLTGTP